MLFKSNGYESEIVIKYSDLEKYKYYCLERNIEIEVCEYSANVFCKIKLTVDEEKHFIKNLKDKYNIEVIKYDIIRTAYVSKLSKNVD